MQLQIRIMLQRTRTRGRLRACDHHHAQTAHFKSISLSCRPGKGFAQHLLTADLLLLLVTASLMCGRLTAQACGNMCRDPYGYDEPPPSYASYDRASSYARAAYDAPPITDRCAILGSSF